MEEMTVAQAIVEGAHDIGFAIVLAAIVRGLLSK